MAKDRESLIEHYRGMRRDLLGAIEGLSETQLTERSLDGWSVKDHLAHIALWDDLRWSEVVRISVGHASAWRMTGEQDAAVNAVVYDLRKELSLPQVLWELETAHRRLVEAIEDASERGLDPSLYGEAGLRSTHEAQHTGWIRRWRQEQSR